MMIMMFLSVYILLESGDDTVANHQDFFLKQPEF